MKVQTFCLQCGEKLPDYTPIEKLYCSTACEKRADEVPSKKSEQAQTKLIPEESSGIDLSDFLIGGFFVGALCIFRAARPRPLPQTASGALDRLSKEMFGGRK